MGRAAMAALLCLVLVGAAVTSLPSIEALTSEARDPVDYRAEPVPVVLLAFDELPVVSLMDRAGGIDEHLFPNFAALQRTSSWYRNATTVAELTRAALPAILTGLAPKELSLSLGGRIPRSVFTIFDQTHEVRTSRAFPTLCDLDVCRPTPEVEKSIRLPLQVFGDEGRGRAFVSFLEMLQPAERPCICVLHLVMPHSPWRYLPSGQQYPGTDPMPGQAESPGPGRKWIQKPWLVELARARHLLQLGFVDRLLGLVIEELRENELFDQALVVVVADHGIAFRPGEHKRAATPATLGEVAYVPLLVKAPAQVIGAVVDDLVETIDLVPTIAQHLNLGDDVAFDGVSLEETQPTRTRRVGGEYIDDQAAERDRALARKFEEFPHLRSWADIFRLAPDEAEGWLGRPIGGYDAATDASAAVTRVDEIERGAPLDPLIPALIEGRLEGSDPNQSNIVLLALDGYIVAATETYQSSGEERFYALVPPAAYVDPPHDLQLFRLGAADRLVELPISP